LVPDDVTNAQVASHRHRAPDDPLYIRCCARHQSDKSAPRKIVVSACPKWPLWRAFMSTDTTDPGAVLSRLEIIAAVQSLTDGEKSALAKIARFYAKRTRYGDEDLLQEAICRVLSGVRTWPRDARAVNLLWGVMRSIAWEWRRRDLAQDQLDSNPPAQEWVILLKDLITSCEKVFGDDPLAQDVLIAMLQGKKGRELSEVVERGVSAAGKLSTEEQIKKDLVRIVKKIRRYIEKYQRETVSP
jgi:hypothetical protein